MKSLHHNDFVQYLRAKASIDDRALNDHVWQCLGQQISVLNGNEPVRILDVGGGIGTMVPRIISANWMADCHYTLLDLSHENIAASIIYLQEFAVQNKWIFKQQGSNKFLLQSEKKQVQLEMETADFFKYLSTTQKRWDLLIAHAFLDLVSLEDSLPLLFSLIRSGGLFYFSLNYNGFMMLEPSIDPELDEKIFSLFHQDMETRRHLGRPTGGSLSGERLYAELSKLGVQINAVGNSDWLINPQDGSYSEDEEFFLFFILATIKNALQDYAEIPFPILSDWVEGYKELIANNQLLFVAHHMDFLGIRP